jgi:hypothetical protein
MKTMKTSILALTFALMSFGTISKVNVKSSTMVTASAISWKSDSIDVGEIPQNKPKSIDFEFKNTGNTVVLITNIQGSCGCTATNYSKEPIRPGETAKVTATYNAASKGAFSKTVTVTTNTVDSPKVLTIKGVVL